jgi:hypothetical protein
VKRRRQPPLPWPPGLATFREAAWVQDGDDLGDCTNEQRAVWRWILAHRRWREARAEWLRANGLVWLDLWIADVRAEHRRRETLRATS